MPIAVGRHANSSRGPGIKAMPGNSDLGVKNKIDQSHLGAPYLVPKPNYAGSKTIRSRPFSTTSLYFSAVTRDENGVILGNCDVHLFRTADDVEVDQTVSDGSGNYTVRTAGSGTFYVVAYKPGSPDVAGTTVNTLIGTTQR